MEKMGTDHSQNQYNDKESQGKNLLCSLGLFVRAEIVWMSEWK